MKKIFLHFIFIALFLCCSVSCFDDNNNLSSGDDEKVWEVLQQLSEKQYSTVMLKINTITDDIELNANYTLTNNEVVYSIEQMNVISLEGEYIDIPTNAKTTFNGTATIKDGKVDKIDGDTIEIPEYSELKGTFNFNKNNFDNIIIENDMLSADVVLPSGFMGVTVNVNDMRFTVKYEDNSLNQIQIFYDTGNSKIIITYKFVI